MDRRRPLFRTKPLGGGIWRIKWHPYSPNRMLVGAMHGGCRILNFGGGCFTSSSSVMGNYLGLTSSVTGGGGFCMSASFEEALQDGNMACQTTKSFTEHESMAYGADWLVCPHPTQNGYFEAAVRYVASKQASGVNIFLSLSLSSLSLWTLHPKCSPILNRCSHAPLQLFIL